MRMPLMIGLMMVLAGVVGCRPSDILDVPPPSGEFTSSAVQGPTAAVQAFSGSKSAMFAVLAQGGQCGECSLIELSGLLGDELTWGEQGSSAREANIDARMTAATTQGPYEAGDPVISALMSARSSLVVAAAALQKYASTTSPASIGEDYALVGYTELLMAEDFCAGVPLSEAVPQGGWRYGTPLTTDSLLLTAEAHFELALAHAAGNDTITALAAVGLGRTLLDLGSVAQAAAAVHSVPTAFVYNTQLEPTYAQNTGPAGPNFYDGAIDVSACGEFTVSDREGGNGLNFVSAQDPRLVIDSQITTTCDRNVEFGIAFADSVFYYPLKFGNPSTGLIPLATGLEARLIEAEAALAANPNDPSGWLASLNTLRNSGCRGTLDSSCVYGTGQVPAQPWGLQSLVDPGSDPGRVSLLSRERAFWLFGTGTRLGDMRRLVRQYGPQGAGFSRFVVDSVYPVGPYGVASTGIRTLFPTYGTDVAMTLPTVRGGSTDTNSQYHGCLTSTQTA